MLTLSLKRLYLLRAAYLLISVGQGLMIWPLIFTHSGNWTLMSGVVKCMLGALSLLALLGLRYPVQMLPLLFWEICWKLIWLIAVALPAWQSGNMDADTAQTAFETGLVALIIIAIPWDVVIARFARAPAERWRNAG